MGVIRSAVSALLGQGGAGVAALGRSVSGVAEVFRPNATRRMELGHDAWMAAHASHAAEFEHARTGRFDAFVNALNRLPRPLLALGTLGLFVHAMADPVGFAARMRGLDTVPEPLWWLLGAVVAFYFGAREAHHLRLTRPLAPPPHPRPAATVAPGPATPAHDNPALAEWHSAAARAEAPRDP
ncbi:MAG: Protein of unknown function (DUF3154) [Rhodobacteraceae bacterium HLUCCA12]|nr:MAG: Protein of unknown function (DUF3154) [Rhodobacteraceae bacterium HLUCCA12]